MAPEHLVQGRGAALGVANDEEAGQPLPRFGENGSAEVVITPERDEVATEILAEATTSGLKRWRSSVMNCSSGGGGRGSARA